MALGGKYYTRLPWLPLVPDGPDIMVLPTFSRSEHRSYPIFSIRDEPDAPSAIERCEVKFGEKISTPAFSSNSSCDTFIGSSPSFVGFLIKYFSPLFGSTN